MSNPYDNPMSNPYDNQIGGDHYKKYEIQPSEFINKNKLLFAEGSAIKYIVRHQDKGGKESLEKAKHFIDMIIERDYSCERFNNHYLHQRLSGFHLTDYLT